MQWIWALLVLVGLTAQPQPQLRPAFDNPDWTTPEPPYRIVGSVHYVGTRDLAAYLIPRRRATS